MTDEFTTAAEAEAARSYSGDWDPGEEVPVDDWGLSRMERDAFRAGAEWARAHLAEQELTDAEVLAALNGQLAVMSPHVPPEPSLDCCSRTSVEAMRAALEAARDARRDKEKRDG